MTQLEQSNQVREIMNDTQNRLTQVIGAPVSLMYKLKVNHINPQLIIQNVCRVTGFTFAQILSKSHEQKYVVARRLIMWLTTYYCGMSDYEVGLLIDLDRSTIAKGIIAVNDMLETNDQLYVEPLRKLETIILELTKEPA